MSTANRESLIAKIKALLSKTVENGCTEAEEMAALAKAQSMMDAYEVTEEDVREVERQEAFANNPQEAHDPWSIRVWLAASVAKFTGCDTYSSGARRYHTRVRFVGLREDLEFAEWLLDHLTAFVQRELAAYSFKIVKEVKDRNLRRQRVIGFVQGCCGRISRRLYELAEQSSRQRTSTGTALVVAKEALVAAAMPKDLRTTHMGTNSKASAHGYLAGQAAGDRATFGRPVGQGGAAALRIGGKK